MDNQEKYDHVFMQVFNVSKSALTDQFTFKETEIWDSIVHLQLITELEDNFEIMFDTEDILNFGSYKNGMKILAKYGISIE